MPKVLVGVMTRNRLRYVRETVQSVLAQTFTDIRVIVSENPTRPEVAQELRAWLEALQDPRVSYVLQPIDGGEYAQGRFLFGQCTEPYFCFMHDDDAMEPGYIAKAVAALEADPGLCLFQSGQHVIDADGVVQPAWSDDYARFQARNRQQGRIDNALDALLEHGLFSISGAIFRTDHMRRSGLVDADLGGIYPFEFNVFLRALEGGAAAGYTPERLLRYRWHDSSMRHTDGASLTDYMVRDLVCLLERRHFKGRSERLRRRLLAFNLRNLSFISLVAGQPVQARLHLRRALGLYPAGLGLWAAALALLVAPLRLRQRFAGRVNLAPRSPGWAQAIPGQEQ